MIIIIICLIKSVIGLNSHVAVGTLEDHLRQNTRIGEGARREEGGGVMSYLLLMGIVGVIFYLVFHNKQKVWRRLWSYLC